MYDACSSIFLAKKHNKSALRRSIQKPVKSILERKFLKMKHWKVSNS